MSRFHLVTNWEFDAPIEAVWERITDSATFTEWWPGFERAEVRGDGGVGTLARYRVRGDFGMVFDLLTRVEEIGEPEFLRLESRGGLVGTGEWRLASDGSTTRVTYTWDVEPSSRVLRALSRIPPLRRRMERSHDGVMEAGGRNLARLLDGQRGIESAAG
jgi:uncharacterized protein YndB with AHSA1/START domain